MDKLKYIRVQEEGETYSSDIPLAVDAENVTMLNGHDLQETLGDLNVTNADDVTTQLSSLHSSVNLLNQQKIDRASATPIITSVVTNWLDTNVNPVGSAVTIDSSLSIQGSAADASAVGENFSNLKKDLNDISTVGSNLFSKNKAKRGYCARITDGVVEANANFYVSELIPVSPNTSYYVARGLGSVSSYFTTVFYNANGAFISGSFNGTTSSYTVTTPANCAYIRVNGALAYIDAQMVSYRNLDFREYQRIINGNSATGVQLISENNIFYYHNTGILKSKSNIAIMFGNELFNFGTSVNVGQGNILYFNKKTATIYASYTFDVSEDVYLLEWLLNVEFDGPLHYISVVSAFPIFEIDLITNTLNINVQGVPAYIIVGSKYYTIQTGYSQKIENLPNVCGVFYDPVDAIFKVSTDFFQMPFNGIPILLRNYRNISGVADVKFTTTINNLVYKRFICYGDSLTWYDGNTFTWGEHQGETCIGFETYIINELNLRQAVNRGESGKTTPEICTKIVNQASDLVNFDYMTIMGGDNDDKLNVAVGTVQPVGGTFDTTTVCGALQNAIETALNVNPSLRIILMTEPMGWTYQNGALDRVSDLIPNAYRNIAKQYGLPVIDLWNESGINELTRNTFYADPPDNENTLYMYHPNNEGWKRLSKIIVNRIKEIG